MAEASRLEPFSDQDRFLRRIAFKNHVKGGIVHWRAFKERELTLSLTFQDDALKIASELDRYQRYFRLFSGDLPGICRIDYFALTVVVEPPLPPRLKRDEKDEKYGFLHCVIDSPTKVQMELLAKIVSDGANGRLLLEFIPASA